MHLLIYNPVSGKDGNDLSYLESLLINNKIEYKLLVTIDEHSISDYFNENNYNYSCIIIAGGDGTISQTIRSVVLKNIKTNILVFPRGTTNEYASTLEINKDTIVKYFDNHYTFKAVDIGVFNDIDTFTYSLIFGNFTHVTYETPQWLKNRIGYFAYWVYGFFNFYVFKIKKYKMTFWFNGKKYDDEFLFGSISNSESLGKVIQLDDVSYSDGLLELILVKAPKTFKQFRMFLGDIRYNKNLSGLIIKDKVKDVKVKSLKKHSWSADGEFSGRFDEVNINIKEKAIKIIV